MWTDIGLTAIQVVTVSVLTNQGFAITISHMISDSRRTEAYQHLYQQLSTMGLRPDYVMADFETAEANAIRAVWPDAVVRGCLFHFLQACERQFKKLKGGRFGTSWSQLVVMLRSLAACRSRQLFDQQLDAMRVWLDDNSLSAFESYFMAQWVVKVRCCLFCCCLLSV